MTSVSDKDIVAVAQKVLETLAPPFVIDGQSLYVTASIGISLYPNDGEDSGTLLGTPTSPCTAPRTWAKIPISSIRPT